MRYPFNFMCFSNVFEQRGLYAKKNSAHFVMLQQFNDSEKRGKTNSGFDVKNAAGLSCGSVRLLKNIMSRLGFDFGFKKVIQFGNSLLSRDTALLNLSKSKIIGYAKHQLKLLPIPITNIFSLTERTFINRAA